MIVSILNDLNARFAPPSGCSNSILLVNNIVTLGLWINGQDQVRWIYLDDESELLDLDQLEKSVMSLIDSEVTEPIEGRINDSQKLDILASALSDHILGGEGGWREMEFEKFVGFCTEYVSVKSKLIGLVISLEHFTGSHYLDSWNDAIKFAISKIKQI